LNGQSPAAHPLQLKFLSSHDPLNVRAFSGTIFHMIRALQEVFPDIEIVRHARPARISRLAETMMRVSNSRINLDYWRPLNRFFAKRLARRWRGQRVLVIGVVNAAVVSELAGLVPVMNVTDATFELMHNFYADFSRYSRRTATVADEIERASILRSVHNSFSSRWAADSAVRYYGAPEDKVSVESWGSNLAPVPRDAVRDPVSRNTRCRLLFLGADWIRKGGDVVCETAQLLASRNLSIQVDLVGSFPPDNVSDGPWLHRHGFLSKGDPAQAAKLQSLIQDADFLFLPTRQDTYGMVFGEANAYGTPALTRAVGGVADVVRNGVNGIVLEEDATPADFAGVIEAVWRDPSVYQRLRESSRREYEERLNWRSWAEAIARIVARLDASNQI
jgi:glycosyltransferase involved in cell wall biosynthesis